MTFQLPDEPTANEKCVNLSDIGTFQQQYNDNFRALRFFGMRYIADEEVVADLIQDLWLKIWERKGCYQNEAAFKNYLFHAFYNTIINHIRHSNVERDYAERQLDKEEEVEQDIHHKMIEAEVYQAINRVFDELPDACRRVYAASLEGKSQKEIASEFSISVNTVKKHINNANHYMKERLKRFLLFFLSFH